MTKRVLLVTVLVVLASAVMFAEIIPSGAHLSVRVDNQLSSGTARSGQTWSGVLARDVVVNGNRVAKAGIRVKGIVAGVKPSGRLHSPGVLSLRVTEVGDQSVRTTVWSRKGKSHTKSNVTKIGGGAGAGALIGGLVSGGKGAGIGALAGTGAGTGVAAATGKKEAVLPAESTVAFTVTDSNASARKR